MKEEANKSLFLWPGGFLLTNDGCGSGRSGFTAPLCQPDMPITLLWQITETIAHSASKARANYSEACNMIPAKEEVSRVGFPHTAQGCISVPSVTCTHFPLHISGGLGRA